MHFKILIAVDGSEEADHAIRYYFHNLHRPGNEITLLHVSEGPVSGSFGFRPGLGISKEDWEKMVHEGQEKIKSLEHRYTAYSTKKGVNEIKFVHEDSGAPGHIIVKTAHKNGMDLIVVGTRGLGSVRRTVLGSVSDYVLHHSDVPVVISRKNEKDRKDQEAAAEGERL